MMSETAVAVGLEPNDKYDVRSADESVTSNVIAARRCVLDCRPKLTPQSTKIAIRPARLVFAVNTVSSGIPSPNATTGDLSFAGSKFNVKLAVVSSPRGESSSINRVILPADWTKFDPTRIVRLPAITKTGS